MILKIYEGRDRENCRLKIVALPQYFILNAEKKKAILQGNDEIYFDDFEIKQGEIDLYVFKN